MYGIVFKIGHSWVNFSSSSTWCWWQQKSVSGKFTWTYVLLMGESRDKKNICFSHFIIKFPLSGFLHGFFHERISPNSKMFSIFGQTFNKAWQEDMTKVNNDYRIGLTQRHHGPASFPFFLRSSTWNLNSVPCALSISLSRNCQSWRKL
jgi:hypothetical protein